MLIIPIHQCLCANSTSTSIYHIPAGQANALQTIKDNIITKTNPLPLAPWTLEHRLLRAQKVNEQDHLPNRFQHLLFVSHHPKHVFAIVSSLEPETGKGGSTDVMIAVPKEQHNTFLTLLTARFSVLWRPTTHLHIGNGVSYSTGEFTIRVGELRQTGTTQTDRGVICCIEVSHWAEGASSTPEEVKRMEDNATAAIKAIWARIGIEGAKEVFTSSATAKPLPEARVWCEVLKLRS
jgi:hypothetical protein